MESQYFFGVDVSKHLLDVAEASGSEVARIQQTPTAIRKWLQRLPPQACIGVESTGDLHKMLVRAAVAAGHRVYVLNANDLSHYARALGRRAKTDRLDALLIARYLAKEYEQLHPYRLPSALQAKLDELISRRHKVVVTRGALRQSFAGMTHRPPALARAMRALQALLTQIDQQLAAVTAQDAQLGPIAQRLQTIMGFGPLVSTTIGHSLSRHDFQRADAFIAYVGLDPRARDSGQKRGRRRLSKRGPAELRRLLFLAAMAASKNSLWRGYYQRYRDRGLPTTAALVILARKLARIAFAMVKHGTQFNAELVRTACAHP
jgi:transposase